MSFQTPSRSESVPQLLIVDDDPAVLDVARSMARAIGCHALVADTAHQGLELFREHADRIHALLVDLHMPGADGFALIRAIRAFRADTRVLLMTGDVLDETALARAGVDPDCVLVKPFHLASLREAVFGHPGRANAA